MSENSDAPPAADTPPAVPSVPDTQPSPATDRLTELLTMLCASEGWGQGGTFLLDTATGVRTRISE